MAKVDPYLRPLYDALYDMVGPEGAQRLIANGTIEVAPLAFMRGRTLNDSFIILDEAQNTTPEQMKMFLTRIGFNSKAVVTGDVTQIDLNGKPSGLGRDRADPVERRGDHLRAPRAPRTSCATGSSPTSSPPTSASRRDIDIYAADEQHDHPIDLERWVRARARRADRRGRARAGRGLADLRRRADDRRAEPAVHGPRAAPPTC